MKAQIEKRKTKKTEIMKKRVALAKYFRSLQAKNAESDVEGEVSER